MITSFGCLQNYFYFILFSKSLVNYCNKKYSHVLTPIHRLDKFIVMSIHDRWSLYIYVNILKYFINLNSWLKIFNGNFHINIDLDNIILWKGITANLHIWKTFPVKLKRRRLGLFSKTFIFNKPKYFIHYFLLWIIWYLFWQNMQMGLKVKDYMYNIISIGRCFPAVLSVYIRFGRLKYSVV